MRLAALALSPALAQTMKNFGVAAMPGADTQLISAPESPPASCRRDQPFLVYKRIAVLGARGVGKSALSIRCAQNRFEPDYMLTFQDMYQWQPVVSGVHYDVCIDDTDGQDENSEFGMRYTTGVDGYILVFSVRDESSFEVIKALNEKLLDTLNVQDRKGTAEVPRVLVGNQIDIVHERQVSKEDALAYAKEQGIPYLESSAFTPCNAHEVFYTVLNIIQQNLEDSHKSHPLLLSNGQDGNVDPSATSNPGCCVQ